MPAGRGRRSRACENFAAIVIDCYNSASFSKRTSVSWRSAGVDDQAVLERLYSRKVIVGSNPTSSAKGGTMGANGARPTCSATMGQLELRF